MTGFPTLIADSPVQNLLAGLLLYASLQAAGGQLTCRMKLPHWSRGTVGVVLGVALFCSGTLWLGFLQAATVPVLGVWLGIWLVAGLPCAAIQLAGSWRRWCQQLSGWDLLLVLPALSLLLTASVVSTKIDELYYHMLVPARIVLDSSLQFHPYPWQSALPQMFYQTGLAPLHAVDLPHAGNVLSACLAIQLASSVRALLRERGHSSFRAAIVGCLVLTGLHPAVWYMTSGAHALGDLCVATAVVLLTCEQRRTASVNSLALGLLLAIAALTKVSAIPLAGGLCVWHLVGQHDQRESLGRRMLSTAAPWVFFWLPLVVWTWEQSGSPFGPLLAGWFGPTIYELAPVQQAMSGSRATARTVHSGLLLEVTAFSATFWCLLAATLRHHRRACPVAVVAFLFQLLLVVCVLPLAQRFLGGAQIALVVLGGLVLQPGQRGSQLPESQTRPWCSTPWRRALLLAGMLPWLAGQLVYQIPFLQRAVNLTPHTQFTQRFVPFRDDLLELDRRLPDGARLLVTGVRPPSVYFPRDIVVRPTGLNVAEIRPSQPVFVFSCDLSRQQIRQRLPAELRLAEVIYENPSALKYASRIPGVPGRQGHLTVYATQIRRPER